MSELPSAFFESPSKGMSATLASRLRALSVQGSPVLVTGELPAAIQRSVESAGIPFSLVPQLDDPRLRGGLGTLILAAPGSLGSGLASLISAMESGGILLLVNLGSEPLDAAAPWSPDMVEIARQACDLGGATPDIVWLRVCCHRALAARHPELCALALAQGERNQQHDLAIARLESRLLGLDGRITVLARQIEDLASSFENDTLARGSAVASIREMVLGLFSSLSVASDARLEEIRRVASELATLRKNLEPALSLAAALRRLFSKREEAP